MIDEEISVGPYVLAGGELPALSIIEATARLVPGVLGNPESLKEETYSCHPEFISGSILNMDSGSGSGMTKGEYPQYTRPEKFKDWTVPDVLLSGHHNEIDKWRKKKSD
jgi:tRNA (guanine37-N1)-methyltransferase